MNWSSNSFLIQAALVIVLLAGFWLLTILGKRGFLLCYPNWRSMTSRVIPRSAGIMLVPMFAIEMLAAGFEGVFPVWQLAVSFMLVWSISLWDDFRDVSAMIRMVVHVTALSLLLSLFDFTWASTLAILLGGLAFMNFFNFMDGMDGLAGSMCLAGSALMLVSAVNGAASGSMFMALGLVLFSAVFLIFNKPPARIFLGDSGSIGLAYLLLYTGLAQQQGNSMFFIAFLLVFSSFIADAGLTLAYRIIRKENILVAHKDHCYQLLAHYYLSVPKVLVLYALIMVLSVALSLAVLTRNAWQAAAILAGWYAVLFAAWGILRWHAIRVKNLE